MEVLSIDDLYLNTKEKQEEVTLKLAQAGIAMKIKSTGKIQLIKKEEIKEIELFRGTHKYNMRIISDTLYNINNISEHKINDIKHFCSGTYNITVFQKELEIDEPNKGKLAISGDFLEFKNNKLIFDVPLNEIENVHAIKNELTFSFKEQKNSVLEIKFVTENTAIADEIKERTEITMKNEMVTFETLQSIVPRGKNDYIFYENYFKMVGSTYEHKILYSNVKQLFWLDKDNNENYLAIETDPPIRQGQTRYNFIVMIFKSEMEEDFTLKLTEQEQIKFPDLKLEYSGSVGVSFLNILRTVTNAKYNTIGHFSTLSGGKNLKCSLKASDGHLYPLEKSLIFMPKAIYMPLNEIQNVEFSRVNVSKFAAKTFDMKIMTTDKSFMFASLPKEDFGQLEQYFSEKNIKITSEVVAEEHSYSSDDMESDEITESE
ncbi:FACT complex subunit [Conglomerata obtusa]